MTSGGVSEVKAGLSAAPTWQEMIWPAQDVFPCFGVRASQFSFGELSRQLLAHVVAMELTVLSGSRDPHWYNESSPVDVCWKYSERSAVFKRL